MLDSISDLGMRLAFERALGHPPPYTSDEVQTIEGPMVVQHAEDLSVLQRCPRLRHLEIFASDINDLGALVGLDRLSHLKVNCSPVTDINALATCQAIEYLELSFTFVEDSEPLFELPNLRRGVILGNPWTPNSYDALRSRSLGRLGNELNRWPLFEFSSELDWQYTRELWERGLKVCFTTIDSIRRVVVNPGIPAFSKADCDFITEPVEFVLFELNRTDSMNTEKLFNLFLEDDEKNDPTRSFDFQSHRTLGSSDDAADWVESSALSEPSRTELLKFIRRFPTLTYYKEDDLILKGIIELSGVRLPQWFLDIRTTLAFVMPNQTVWVQFDDETNYRLGGDFWYKLDDFGGAEEERHHAEQVGGQPVPFAVGNSLDSRSILAINLADSEDQRLYEYNSDNIYDPFYNTHPLLDADRPLFHTYAEMFSHIAAIKLQREEKPEIIRSHE